MNKFSDCYRQVSLLYHIIRSTVNTLQHPPIYQIPDRIKVSSENSIAGQFISFVADEDLHGRNILLLTFFCRCYVKCSKYLERKGNFSLKAYVCQLLML